MNAEDLIARLKYKLEHHRTIDEGTGCWLWLGAVRPNGYGYMSVCYKNYSVHRLSASIYLDFELSSKKQINHKSICPNKHCYNPDHLYIGNQSQNLHDYYGDIKDRICPHGHSMSNAVIYKSHEGKTYRWCRSCRTIANRTRSAKV